MNTSYQPQDFAINKRLGLIFVSSLLWATTCFGQTLDPAIAKLGQQVYMTTCNTCHKPEASLKAPGHFILSSMPPRAILAALETGKMRVQAKDLSDEQRKAVAQWLSNKPLTETVIPKEAYTQFKLPDAKKIAITHTGWGGDLEGTGFRTAKQAGITAASVGSLKLKWAFAFPDVNQVRSKPAIVGDWLIMGTQFGDVYCLNKQSGKIGWHFTAKAAIRGVIHVVQKTSGPQAFFADNATNVYALDVKTGKLLWEKRVGQHSQAANTGSVVVYDNMVYVPLTSLEVVSVLMPGYPCCSSSGEVVALNAQSGNEVWRHRVIAEEAKETGKKKDGTPAYGPAGGIVWCSPTVDTKRGLLYIGTGENYTHPVTNTSDAIQALNLKTGKLAWNFQATQNDAWNMGCPGGPNCPDKPGNDLDFGMAPILVKQPNGNDMLVVGQKSAMVYGLSPDDGKLIWKTAVGLGSALGGIHWGMATDGKYVYAANADNKYALFGKTDSLHRPAPGIYALEVATGKLVWKTASPPCGDKKGCIEANSAAPTVIPGVVFAGALDGHIRAYSSIDGKIIWDYDTVHAYETVNGVQGKGGSLDGPSPVVADGMLFVNSGYGLFGELPGNVLLAFEVEK
ncbi:outer membrane protein assembly factor BamB family protein [Spirosoma pollinicola]|uniref:Dehydrogenase n=1 Tax=Spirosoma pollinicola TaxID=2057025 RepID=A0A2K8Z1C9_9BACT|nr:PQQ-binding-like beta-propeller repeat protein [Spirosoma pollinicola]AUD03702.1 dehydrogenase [Spirosoma pollinicola]